jgi:uncharacterized protein
MLRVVLLLLGVAALIWLLRRGVDPGSGRRAAERAKRARPAREVDELVRCAHCGVHLPRVEAQTQNGRQFCSPEHARLGSREDGP